MYIDYNSKIRFEGNSTVNFIDNHAGVFGGVMYIVDSILLHLRETLLLTLPVMALLVMEEWCTLNKSQQLDSRENLPLTLLKIMLKAMAG